MRIVKFKGAGGGFFRVGVYLAEMDHTWMGRVALVRTPYNIIAGQQFDYVSADRLEEATAEELERHAETVIAEAAKKLAEFTRQASHEPPLQSQSQDQLSAPSALQGIPSLQTSHP